MYYNQPSTFINLLCYRAVMRIAVPFLFVTNEDNDEFLTMRRILFPTATGQV